MSLTKSCRGEYIDLTTSIVWGAKKIAQVGPNAAVSNIGDAVPGSFWLPT